MRRIHLIELEDLPWIPQVLRDGITDFLELAVVRTPLYDPVAPRLMGAIARSRCEQVLDLCSGGGGAWLRLVENLPDPDTGVLLTDLYPNRDAFARIDALSGGRIKGVMEPVDATRVPAALTGFRTLFSSFHHLRPAQARAVLLDAVKRGEPIAVLESTQRHILLIAYMLLTPLLVLLFTPFMRPLRLSKLIFTYLVPLIPLMVLFDGVVSCLRTYTVGELADLVESLPDNDFTWSIGLQRLPGLPVGVTYLIGMAGGDSPS